jgi:hypothetical protein
MGVKPLTLGIGDWGLGIEKWEFQNPKSKFQNPESGEYLSLYGAVWGGPRSGK